LKMNEDGFALGMQAIGNAADQEVGHAANHGGSTR
jgi:hypothetical protein